MREIVVTGFSEQGFKKLKNKHKGISRCYLCKRNQDQQGIFYDPQDSSAKSNELSFSWIETIQHYSNEDVRLRYFVCHECLALLEGIQERTIFSAIKA